MKARAASSGIIYYIDPYIYLFRLIDDINQKEIKAGLTMDCGSFRLEVVCGPGTGTVFHTSFGAILFRNFRRECALNLKIDVQSF